MYIPDQNTASKIAKKHGTPVFITDKNILIDRLRKFKSAFKWPKTSIFYAIKANTNPAIVKTLKEAGVDGIDAVSPWEVELAKRMGFSNKEIIFTGNNCSSDELCEVHKKGVLLNIGSLSELDRFGQMFPGESVSVRINTGVGDGESPAAITGGLESQFGINRDDFDKTKGLLKKHNLVLSGIHCHIGSGFYKTDSFEKAVCVILQEAASFENLDFIDFGGGFGIRYSPKDKPINLSDFYQSIKIHLQNFSTINKKAVEIRLEPGKFLVGESTCLLVKVTTIKKISSLTFVGVDSGFNHLIRPAFYGSYHHIVNISRPDRSMVKVDVIGNICESCDVFGKNIAISEPREGDLLAILTAGAYTTSMSSLYNLRPYASEVLVDKDKLYLTRDRVSFDKTLNSLGYTDKI